MATINSTYDPKSIEARWQAYWFDNQTYKATSNTEKPGFYVLDMFPYPSGAGLHVGHPLGYIASDIYSRYKRHKGFEVLHPMGFDAFGLPAEQYAIQTGQHPAVTTEQNSARYREQLMNIGLSFDWDREVSTADPAYYRWTQWIFIKLFHHYYDLRQDKALPIEQLINALQSFGSNGVQAAASADVEDITAAQWAIMDEAQKEAYLQNFRLAFTAEAFVNWCPALGTVLANDEVKDGFSERGGYPVERKKMRQFMLRISAYAQRLLNGLHGLDWPEAIVEQQRNWIGRSQGAELRFAIEGKAHDIEVFTTRPDTIYGVSFLVLAPEHELVSELTTTDQKANVETYIEATARRSELDRKADVKRVSGVFTGSYALHPLTGQKLPIWLADYVLAGYGSGAIMAVPCSDTRDYAFAKHFDLPVPIITEGPGSDITAPDFDPKKGELIASESLNGLSIVEGIEAAVRLVEVKGFGRHKITYRMRDAVFSRQRYWGEPVPVYYENDIPKTLPESELPLVLPSIDKYQPTETGEPPLARAVDWTYKGHALETTTMPGWAGSSWYFLRYQDPHNELTLADAEALKYWGQVDLYLGGSEHATGHLLYARFWTKILYDLGVIPFDEPFKKLVNQGMIQGRSSIAWRLPEGNTFVSAGQREGREVVPIHVDVSLVENDVLDQASFKSWRPDLATAQFITEPDGRFFCTAEVEKMSKRLYNVVNPDDVIERYGADTLRLYEMFLGPLEQSKPWNTQGIEGVAKFLRKTYRLYVDETGEIALTDEAPTPEELKHLHTLLKRVTEDIERLSYNTIVSAYMICANELTSLQCHKCAILEPLAIALSPMAPHLAEELWSICGKVGSVTEQPFPEAEDRYLVADTVQYPISINGRTRVKLDLPAGFSREQVQEAVLSDEQVAKYLTGTTLMKVIVVPGRIVNLVTSS